MSNWLGASALGVIEELPVNEEKMILNGVADTTVLYIVRVAFLELF